MQSHPENEKKKKPWYHPKKIAEYDRKTDYVVTGASWTLSGFEQFIPAMERLQHNLGFISLFFTILAFPYHIYNFIYALAWSKETNIRRGTRIAISVTGLALASIVLIAAVGVITGAASIIMIVSAAKTLIESVWRTGLSLYERFFGQGSADAKEIKHLRTVIKENWPGEEAQIDRLTKLTNKQRKRNGAIANSLHVVAMNVVGIIAVGLLFSGVTSAAGTGILIGLSIYGAADAVGLNPIKRAGQLINWGWKKFTGKPLFSPFTPKTKDELKAELYNELTKKDPVVVRTRQPAPAAVHAPNSETQIISGLQNSAAPPRAAPPSTPPLKTPDPAYPLTSYLSKTSSVIATNANDKLTKPTSQQKDEEEGESEGEHPTKPSNNHH